MHHIVLAILLLHVITSSCQEEFKVKEVTLEDLKIQRCDFDSSASALMLFDIGELKMGFSGISKYSRHLRVKIFNRSSIDEWSNHGFLIEIGEQSIPKIEASTYTLNGNNIEVSELSQDNIFKSKFDKYRKQVRFTMPNVTEGSIIDIYYSFNISSILPWQFQYSIPTQLSQYNVKIPIELDFKTELQGQLPITKISGHEKFKGGIWTMIDVPAFKSEPYISASADFISTLHFRKNLEYKDWVFMANRLIGDEDFGGRIFEIKPLKNLTKKFTDSIANKAERVRAILEYVKNEVEWDGTLSMYSYSSPLTTLKVKRGSSGDINLLLIALLNSADILVQPTLISTRGNGLPKPHYPSLWQFNDVIGLVNLGTRSILIDGTDRSLNFQTIPARCMNASGFVIGRDSSYWIPIINSKSRFIINANLQLNNDGVLSGEAQTLRDGLEASNHRRSLDTLNQETFLKLRYPRIEISDYSIENLKSQDQPFKEKFKISEQSSQSNSSTIYFNPVIIPKLTENPFVADKRFYPIDFEDTYDFQYTAQIKVPQDFIIEEYPNSNSISLPENSGRFSYQIQADKNILNIKIQLTLNKRVFTPNEYPSLREFIALIISKQSELVVAKRIN